MMDNPSAPHLKPIDNPKHISLLLPTRNRPAYLTKLFDSLEETTYDKSAVDIWGYVDDDDAVTQEFIRSGVHSRYSFKINWVIGERTKTQGEMLTILWRRSTTNAGIYFSGMDDCVFLTKNWDEIIRAAFDRYPDRIMLAYPDEATAQPGQVTLAILSAEWANITGKILTSYFPFWFDDAWLDQVAQMIQRKVQVDIQTNPLGNKGKTIRMRNLRFWGRFFHNTLDERIAEAALFRRAIYPEDSAEYLKSCKQGEELAQRFEQSVAWSNDENAIYTEWKLAGGSAQARPSERYLAVEAEAVNHLFGKARVLFGRGHFEKALVMLDNIHYASFKFQNLEYARALCLKSLGMYDEAHQAELAELALNSDTEMSRQDWPEMRRLISVSENTAVTDLRLSPLSKLRIHLMPITLRLGIILSVVKSHPIYEWGPTFKELWVRYRRRRQTEVEKGGGIDG